MKLKKKIKIVISADGGAGSGKTTGSKLIAKKFNLKLLSSGLLYRYCAYKLLKNNRIKNKKTFLKKIVKKITIKKLENKNLYSPEVTEYASTIAKIKFVRDLLKYFQVNFAKSKKCIIEGRDIGTIILPGTKSDLKLFFKCSLNTKAKRRFLEYKKNNKKITFKQVKNALKLRDLEDTKRKISPLRPAKGAVIVDTSKINIKQMSAKLFHIVYVALKKKYGKSL